MTTDLDVLLARQLCGTDDTSALTEMKPGDTVETPTARWEIRTAGDRVAVERVFTNMPDGGDGHTVDRVVTTTLDGVTRVWAVSLQGMTREAPWTVRLSSPVLAAA